MSFTSETEKGYLKWRFLCFNCGLNSNLCLDSPNDVNWCIHYATGKSPKFKIVFSCWSFIVSKVDQYQTENYMQSDFGSTLSDEEIFFSNKICKIVKTLGFTVA